MGTPRTIDPADQRYYTSVLGRFRTPDPYMATANGATNPTNPQSWNHYAYAGSDPVNHNDPSGQDWCDDDTLFCFAIDFTTSGGGPFGNLSAYFPSAALIAAQVEAALQNPNNTDSNTSTCWDWTCMPAAYARAIQALTLNPDCMDLFGNATTRAGNFNPINVLTNIVWGPNSLGSVHFSTKPPSWGQAFTRPAGFVPIPSLAGKVSITINEFAGPGYWNAGDTNDNAETLLHELAHAFNFLRGSGGFAISNLAEAKDKYAFDTLIKKDCGL